MRECVTWGKSNRGPGVEYWSRDTGNRGEGGGTTGRDRGPGGKYRSRDTGCRGERDAFMRDRLHMYALKCLTKWSFWLNLTTIINKSLFVVNCYESILKFLCYSSPYHTLSVEINKSFSMLFNYNLALSQLWNRICGYGFFDENEETTTLGMIKSCVI